MHSNDKFYTFLLSHSSKSRIYFRRVEVSKKLLKNGLFSLAIFLGLSTIGVGVFGVFNYTISAHSDVSPESRVQSRESETGVPANASLLTTPASLDYSRPSDNQSINSGGPFLPEQSTLEDAELEGQIRVIRTTGNPAFIPAIWAHMGKINNEFGFRRNPFGGRNYEFHAGMDIDGERGDLVMATANGIVTEAGWKGGYGQMIEIDHGNGLKTRYGHLSKVGVAIGDSLTRGQLMGFVGSTGRSTGPHLHYELRLNDKPINPRRLLPPELTELKKIAG